MTGAIAISGPTLALSSRIFVERSYRCHFVRGTEPRPVCEYDLCEIQPFNCGIYCCTHWLDRNGRGSCHVDCKRYRPHMSGPAPHPGVVYRGTTDEGTSKRQDRSKSGTSLGTPSGFSKALLHFPTNRTAGNIVAPPRKSASKIDCNDVVEGCSLWC